MAKTSTRSFACTCDWVSRSLEPSSFRSCTGKANNVFGKRSSRDCSQTTTSSTSWWHLHLGDSSRDFTAYIVLHWHRTTTSTEVLPRLVWLIQRITTHRLPPATAPPLGTLSSCCGFICSSWFALSVECTNRVYTSCYDLWYEFSTHD
jgi:hypothetical protein